MWAFQLKRLENCTRRKKTEAFGILKSILRSSENRKYLIEFENGLFASFFPYQNLICLKLFVWKLIQKALTRAFYDSEHFSFSFLELHFSIYFGRKQKSKKQKWIKSKTLIRNKMKIKKSLRQIFHSNDFTTLCFLFHWNGRNFARLVNLIIQRISWMSILWGTNCCFLHLFCLQYNIIITEDKNHP